MDQAPVLDELAIPGNPFFPVHTAPIRSAHRPGSRSMTGQLPSRHGSYNIGTTAADTGNFLSTVLTQNGYRTHQIGKVTIFDPLGLIPSLENRETAGDQNLLRFCGV